MYVYRLTWMDNRWRCAYCEITGCYYYFFESLPKYFSKPYAKSKKSVEELDNLKISELHQIEEWYEYGVRWRYLK